MFYEVSNGQGMQPFMVKRAITISLLALLTGCSSHFRSVNGDPSHNDGKNATITSDKAVFDKSDSATKSSAQVEPSADGVEFYSDLEKINQALQLQADLWEHVQIPNKKATRYEFLKLNTENTQKAVVKAFSEKSFSLLRKKLHVRARYIHNKKIKFAWRVEHLLTKADMSKIHLEDSPVRVVLAFGGDRAKFSMKNKILSELSEAVLGEELPYASLVYVWCNRCEPESVIVNPRTDRIRKIAINSGSQQLQHWVVHERDIQADFYKAFGEAPGDLISIALVSDSDNTKGKTTAWFSDVALSNKSD